MLTAALVCIPALPKIFTIVSDAPLITFGCSIKSSVELTKPVNFMQDLILDKSFVRYFLAGTIKFTDIVHLNEINLEKIFAKNSNIMNPSLIDIKNFNEWIDQNIKFEC